MTFFLFLPSHPFSIFFITYWLLIWLSRYHTLQSWKDQSTWRKSSLSIYGIKRNWTWRTATKWGGKEKRRNWKRKTRKKERKKNLARVSFGVSAKERMKIEEGRHHDHHDHHDHHHHDHPHHHHHPLQLPVQVCLPCAWNTL